MFDCRQVVMELGSGYGPCRLSLPGNYCSQGASYSCKRCLRAALRVAVGGGSCAGLAPIFIGRIPYRTVLEEWQGLQAGLQAFVRAIDVGIDPRWGRND